MQLSPLIVTFFLAALALAVSRAFAARFDLLDRPSSRKHHSGAVPMVGGISIFFGAWFGLMILSTLLNGLLPLFFASLLMVGVGMQDDRVDLSVAPRFVTELVAVLVVALAGDLVLFQLGDPWIHIISAMS